MDRNSTPRRKLFSSICVCVRARACVYVKVLDRSNSILQAILSMPLEDEKYSVQIITIQFKYNGNVFVLCV